MSDRYDVIVVGAGPAGASAAKTLVDAGKRVAVIEKCTFPRYKCCSGLLSEGAMAFLNENYGGVPGELFCSNPDILFTFSKTCRTFVPDENTKMKNVFRERFDHWLIEQSGAEVLFGHTVKAVEEKEGRVEVVVKEKGGEKLLSADYLIGADGGNSTVRRLVDEKYDKNNYIFAYQLVYDGELDVDDKYFYFLTSKKFSQEFSWFNLKDDGIYIGTSWYMDNKENSFVDNIKSKLKEIYDIKLNTVKRREGCMVDTRLSEDKFFFGKGRILMTGEASGLITRFYEGISEALTSGKKAAQAIIGGENILDSYIDSVSEEKEYIVKIWGTF